MSGVPYTLTMAPHTRNPPIGKTGNHVLKAPTPRAPFYFYMFTPEKEGTRKTLFVHNEIDMRVSFARADISRDNTFSSAHTTW